MEFEMTFKIVVDKDQDTQKYYFEVYEYESETRVAFKSDPIYLTADDAQADILDLFARTKP